MIRPLLRALGSLREHEQLLVISLATVLIMAGQGVVVPILPLYAAEFGVGAAVIGLTLSFFALARLILNVPSGILADRRGRRVLLVGGPLVTAVGMYGSGLAGDIVQLLVWRFVAGAGSAMYMTGAQIYLADISTPATRARFIGTNQSALLLGIAVGPAIGGIVAEFWGLRAPFMLVGTMAVISTVYSYWRLPETRPAAPATPPVAEPRTGERRPRRAWVSFVLSRDFIAVAGVTFAIFFTRSGARQTLIPLMAYTRLGFTTGSLGVLFTVQAVANIAFVLPASVIADRWGRKLAIIPGCLLAAVMLVLTGLSTTSLAFVLATMGLAIGTSLSGPAPATYAADIAPAQLRGIGLGLYRSTGDLGLMIGPPLLGALADLTSYGWAFAVNAALMTAAALFFLTARETLERGPTTARPGDGRETAGGSGEGERTG